jgi:hypothetical protein
MYYGMVKSLPIILCNPPGELDSVSSATHPNIMGKGETDHSMTLSIGAADLAIFGGKTIMLTRDFGHYCK